MLVYTNPAVRKYLNHSFETLYINFDIENYQVRTNIIWPINGYCLWTKYHTRTSRYVPYYNYRTKLVLVNSNSGVTI